MVKQCMRRCSARLHQMPILFLTLALVLLAAKPVYAAARETVTQLLGEHRVHTSSDSYRALPAWFPPAELLPSARPRPLQLGPLHHFYVDVPASGTAGVGFPTTVEARDKDENPVTIDATISLATNTGQYISPTSVLLESGQWSGNVTLTTVGVSRLVRAISVTITGSDFITIQPGTLGRFEVTTPGTPQVAGVPFSVTVTAYDLYENLKTNYVGPVTFTSSDPLAQLPTDDGSDWSNGTAQFELELRTTGSQTYRVTDAVTDVTKQSGGITVQPGPLGSFTVTTPGTSQVAGVPFNVTVAAYDVYGNIKTDYFGTVTFDSSDERAVLPTDSPTGWNGGAKQFSLQLRTTGSQTYSVTDDATDITKESDDITVDPGALGSFEVTTPGTPQVAGAPFDVTVTAHDVYENIKTDYIGTVTFDSGDEQAVLPIDSATGWSNGVKPFSLELRTAGSQWYSVEDGIVTQQSGNIVVNPGPLAAIHVNSAPDNGGAIHGHPVTVTTHIMDIYATYPAWAGAYDAWDNYRGDVSVNWGGTGVLDEGDFNPAQGISTTFTPAPVLSGTGTIRARYGSGPGEYTDYTGTFTIQAPLLVIGKRDSPDPVSAGGFLQYTIVYTNTGYATARDVRITESYDPNVTFVNAGPWPNEGNNVWTRSSVAPDERRVIYVTVQVKDSLPLGTLLNNLVTISGSRVETHSAALTTTVTSAPDLRVDLSDLPDPVSPGGNLVYQIHYSNAGNAPVKNTVITMTYDSQVTFLTSDVAPRSGTDNVWDLGTVEGHTSGDINVTVVVDDYVPDEDILNAAAEITGEKVGSFQAFESTMVRAPALTLAKRAALDPVLADSPLTYTLVFTNIGGAATSALLVTDAVPQYTSYARCAPKPCSHSNGIVTWQRPALGAGGSDSLSLVVNVQRNVDSGTSLINRARVRIVDTPRFSATTRISTTVVSSPSLRLSMSNGQSSVQAGDHLVYVLYYENTGNGRAYDTTIAVTPPASQLVRDLACEPECRVDDGKLYYDVGTVPGGTIGSVKLYGIVRLPLPAGTWTVAASATILTTTPGDPPEGNSVQDIDPVATRPDLQVAVDYDGHTPYPGKRITYTLQYSNTAPIGTTGVVVTAQQPDETTFDPAASSEWEDQGDGYFLYPVGSLGYREGGTLTFVVILPGGIFSPTTPSFDALFTISDDGHSGQDAVPTNNTKLAAVGLPDLVIERVEVNWESLLSRQPGDHVTVTLKNVGTNTACNPVPPTGEGPQWCGRFFLDLYINPAEPPKSYPTDDVYGIGYRDDVGPILAGQSLAYTITLATNGQPLTLPADIQPPLVLYVRVDNFAGRRYGLVAEYDEWNNVTGPIRMVYKAYLPILVLSH